MCGVSDDKWMSPTVYIFSSVCSIGLEVVVRVLPVNIVSTIVDLWIRANTVSVF